MRIMFGMFLFAFWVFSTLECEVVIFTKFRLACVHVRALKYLDVLVLHRACVLCMCVLCMPNVMSVGFTYNVNHVIMTSSVFVFHLCHTGMRLVA